MKIEYVFERFVLTFDGWYVCTIFEDKTESWSGIMWADEYHGNLLGISPAHHRLQHELAHHVLAIYLGEPYCPIVWRDAHGEEQPKKESERREWLVTALQYFSRGLQASQPFMRQEGLTKAHEARRGLNYLLIRYDLLIRGSENYVRVNVGSKP